MSGRLSADSNIETIKSDPVCGIDVSFERASVKKLVYVYGHKFFVFCSVQCLKEFQKHPQQYVIEESSKEIVGVCELCGKKMHKGEDTSTTLLDGTEHKFCCPICLSVYLKSQ